MNRKILLNLLKIAISLILIAIVLSRIDINALGSVFAKAHLGWIGVATVLMLLNVVVRAKRWQILLADLEIRVPLRELTTIYYIGAAFSNLLPTAVGGDPVRMVELNRHTDRASDAVTSVIVDRFLGLYASLVLGFVTSLVVWNRVPQEVIGLSVLFFVGMTAVGVVLVYEPLYQTLRQISLIRRITDIKFIHKLFESFQDYSPKALGIAFLFGLLVQLVFILSNFTIGQALGIALSPLFYLVFVPLINLTLTLPAFAGFGVREASYATLFGEVGVSNEAAVALSLTVYALGNLAPGLVGGALYLWRSARGLQVRRES